MGWRLNRKEVACSVAIAVVCLVGDKNSRSSGEADLAAAICDNMTHAIVGTLTWLGVLAGKSTSGGLNYYFEILLCGICSSVIDVDHFISARSFSLKGATSLTERPMFHCTSGALFGCSCLLALAFKLEINWLLKFGWILVAAFISHHIRDSTRRGLWMWPFGSTKPLPYGLYIALECLLPQGIAFLMSYVGMPGSKRDYDTVEMEDV